MARQSPLTQSHLDRGASVTAYPDPTSPTDETRAAGVVEAFDHLELEYAAIRKGCALLDQPHRAVILVRGDDRVEFLNRMLTQELKDLAPGTHRKSFWLNRKGRIDADLRVLALDDHLRFDVDVHRVAHTVQTLTDFMFSEDLAFEDATESHHRLALHGPTAIMFLSEIASQSALAELRPGHACDATIAGHALTIERGDTLGEIGLELTCETASAADIYNAILHAATDDTDLAHRARCRPAGWHAANIARIEAGTPLYYLDFDENALPHETNLIDSRVSFTKGCYLGQEVVARMQARGQSKQKLIAFGVQGHTGPDSPLPVADANCYAATDPSEITPDTKPIGRVTSSTLSPMRSMAPIGFAMVRQAHAEPDTDLLIEAEGGLVHAKVQTELSTLPARAR